MGIEIQPPGPSAAPASQTSRSVLGTVTAPGAGGTIATITTAIDADYQVAVTIMLTGTITAAELNNFKVTANGVTLATLPIGAAAPASEGPLTYNFNVFSNGANIIVAAVGAGGVAAVYTASITVLQVT